MSALDKKGKLFGVINAIDLVLILIIFAGLCGFIFTKVGGYSPLNKVVKMEGQAEVKIAIRGARVEDLNIFNKYKKAFIIIRNQPYTDVEITNVRAWRRELIFFDDQARKAIKVKNPDEDYYVTDADIIIRDKAQFIGTDIVFGGNKIKAGIPVELETLEYKFSGSVISVNMVGVTDTPTPPTVE